MQLILLIIIYTIKAVRDLKLPLRNSIDYLSVILVLMARSGSLVKMTTRFYSAVIAATLQILYVWQRSKAARVSTSIM